MTPTAIEYFRTEWKKLSKSKLKTKLGELQRQGAWVAVELLKSIIREKNI